LLRAQATEWRTDKTPGDLEQEIMGTDNMKGWILLTDCRTALKQSHHRTLMSKDLRLQFCYANEQGEDKNILTIWYWPKMKQPQAALIITWADPPCPADTNHHWMNNNSDSLYSGTMDRFAILTGVDFFKPASWIQKLKQQGGTTARDDTPTDTAHAAMQADDENDDDALVSFFVNDYETYVLIRRPCKNGFTEVKKKILFGAFSNFEGMYRIVNDRESQQPIYEIYFTMKNNPHAQKKIITIMDPKVINDHEISQYQLVRIPICFRQDDLKTNHTLMAVMSRCWASIGFTITHNFNLNYLREILAIKSKLFLANPNKKTLRAIDNFGFQYHTGHTRKYGVFCFANCAIDSSTGQILTHEEAGFKLMDELFLDTMLTPTFYPKICPVEDDAVRLRFFRTLIHLARRFSAGNYQAFMVGLASYFCAPKYEYIQNQMHGVFITVLTSAEGSTGKTEILKMLNSLYGLDTKAMCASTTQAGLYEIVGKLFACMPVAVDDLQTGDEKVNKLDETIKSLYDAMSRSNFYRSRSCRCQVMITTNNVFCPNNQPVQSRLLLQNIKKSRGGFNVKLMPHWRRMQTLASMLCIDILEFPIKPDHVTDCVEYMQGILQDKCVGTRSSMNWGLALYFRILIQRLIPCETEEWDEIFKYFSTEICRTTVEYSADAGVMDKFVSCFRLMQTRNNGMDPDGICFNLHNLRILTTEEKQKFDDLDEDLEYYAFDLEHLVDVMTVRLRLKKEDFNLKQLKLMLQGPMHTDGVRRHLIFFYNKTLMLHHQKRPEAGVITEDIFASMDQDNKQYINAYIVPKYMMDDKEQDDTCADFKNILISSDRNFYNEVVEDSWRGFIELRDTKLFKVAEEEGLWQDDAWDDPEYESNQFKMVENMSNLYRPEGVIPWPRVNPQVNWVDDFYRGHAEVSQDAEKNREAFERTQAAELTERVNRLNQEDDDEETGPNEFDLDDPMIEDDLHLGNPDEDPFIIWARATYGLSNNLKQCRCCRATYTNDLPTHSICGACMPDARQQFNDAQDELRQEEEQEAQKRQKTTGDEQAEEVSTDSDDDDFDPSQKEDDGESLGDENRSDEDDEESEGDRQFTGQDGDEESDEDRPIQLEAQPGDDSDQWSED